MLCKLNYWPLLTKISQKDFKHTIVDTPTLSKQFYNTFPGTATKAAHGGSFIGGAKAHHA
jgi:hypothetical protein